MYLQQLLKEGFSIELAKTIKSKYLEQITISDESIKVNKEIIEKINQRSIEATLDDSNLLNSSTRKVKIKLPTGVNLLEYTPNKIQIIKND